MVNNAAFEEEVKEHFLFLVTDYGFRLNLINHVASANYIKFESKEVFVYVFYGPPSFEVGMCFGRIGIDDLRGTNTFGPGDLILLYPTWSWNPKGGTVAEFARCLRECGSECLKGDQLVFAQMKKTRETRNQKWRQEERIKKVRQDADDAWRQKKYDKVVELYESIGTVLKGSESKKLSYARKHLKI